MRPSRWGRPAPGPPGKRRPVSQKTSLAALLRHKPYRRLWLARTVSQWGDAFNTVALALLVYSLTGTGLGVSAVVVAEILPVLALAPVAFWSTGCPACG